MAGTDTRRRAPEIMAEFVRHATERDAVPQEVAEYAARATTKALRRRGARAVSERAARAYFDKVVERRLVRRHGGSCAAARVVAGCIVADLVESGRTPSDAFEELSRGWSGALPPVVLEEYRRKLCA